MGEIVRTARVYAINNLGLVTTKNSFGAIFETIESELQKLAETVGKKLREQDKEIKDLEGGIGDLFEMLKRRTKSIEALEEFQKQIEALIDLESFREWLKSLKIKKDPLPYDQHNNPPGGLKRGDVISYIINERESKGRCGQRILGQFHEVIEGRIYAYWQDWDTGELPRQSSFMLKDRVTFEFRPRFPDRKER